MQFVGLLLIVNSLVGAAWWVASGRPQMVVVPICVAALSAGVFLIVHERGAVSGSKNAAPAATSPGMDELARQTADARTLLADLQDQTAAADWHLKQLDEHIHKMKILPDGRTRVGDTVTGQAAILIPKIEALQKLSAENRAEAHPLARECVAIYEATREQMNGVVVAGGELGPDLVAWLYATAATVAQRSGEHDQALMWAQAAIAARPSVERQFLLVTALINKDLQPDANAVIQRELKAGGPDAAKFRQFLDQYKIPYKRPE